MPSADQVPVNFSHSKMRWPMWVVLITGSTRLHYVLSALSNRSLTPSPARSRSSLPSHSAGLTKRRCVLHDLAYRASAIGSR